MSCLELAGIVLLSQGWAPAILADLPSLVGLEVHKVFHRRAGEYDNSYGKFRRDLGPESELRHEPEQLIIRGGARGRPAKWTIGIDLEARVVGYADWDVVFDQHHGGSGELGVLVFGLPGIIASLPLQFPWWALRSLGRTLTGLTLHQQLLFIKLRPQLPERWQVPLLRALRNENNGVAAAHWERVRRTRRENDDNST